MAYSFTRDEEDTGFFSSNASSYQDSPALTANNFYIAAGSLNAAKGLLTSTGFSADTDVYHMGSLGVGTYTVSAASGFWFFGSGYSNFVTPIVTIYDRFGTPVAGNGFSSSVTFNVTTSSEFYVGVQGSSFQSSQYSVSYTYTPPVNYQADSSALFISGNLTAGNTILLGGTFTDSNGLSNANATNGYTYGWYISADLINWTLLSQNPTYTILTQDTGKYIDVLVSFYDDAGNLETVSPNGQFIADATPPTLTISASDTNLTVGETALIQFALSESSSNFTLADISVTSGIISNFLGSGSSYTATYTPLVNSTSTAVISVSGGTFSDSSGNTNSSSSSISLNVSTAIVVSNSPATGAVSISGTARQGQVLTASNTLADVDGIGTVTYQWRSNGTNISGATGSTFTLRQTEVGTAITVVASYTDQLGSAESVASGATVSVANVNDSATGAVSISGTARQGQVLTASNTLADVDGIGTVTYQWRSNGTNISGATGSTFTLRQTEVGTAITVVASYTDQLGSAESVVSGSSQTVEAVLSATYTNPISSIDSIGVSPDGQFLLIKVDGVTQSVPIGSSLSFNGSTVTTSDLTSSITVQPVFQSSGGSNGYALPEVFTGPASLNLDYQLIETGYNAVVIGGATNDFIKVASTDSLGKAVDGGGGDDVIDGGVGSTFISGGSGSNTIFLDGRAPGVSWSTVTDFKFGQDKATIWGWKAGVSKVSTLFTDFNTGGAAGYTGLTLHFENLLPDGAPAGQTNSNFNSITLTGLTLADFGATSLADLNAQISAGTNSHFIVGQTVDAFGEHGYLFLS